MWLGQPSSATLPPRGLIPVHMVEVKEDRLYSSLSDLGYVYSGEFWALSDLTRKAGRAFG